MTNFRKDKFFLIIFPVITLLFLLSPTKTQASIEVYPALPSNSYMSDLYTVEVWDGANWVSSYTYLYRQISNTLWHPNTNVSTSFTTFGTTGSVNVRVSKVSGNITSVQISPISKNISATISGGKATFTLNQNDKAWLTINGDDSNPLFIFADPPKPAIPSGATYFGPGVQDIAPGNSNHYIASNNEIIYIDGGAWVRGNIDTRGKSGVQILGPGILSGDLWNSATIQQLGYPGFLDYAMITGGWGAVSISSIKNITIVNSPSYNISAGTNNVYGVKLISPWNGQTDGFQTGVSNVDQSFAFVGDNVFFPAWAGTNNNNVTVTNSFAGTTNNAVFAGGYWGNSSSNTYTSLVDNVDVKTYMSDIYAPGYFTPSVFQIWVDNNDSTYGYSNQTYQNIRIEGNLNAPMAELKNFIYPFTGGGPNPPLGNSYDIVFKNISVSGSQKYRSAIKGYDNNNGFHNVILENINMNGTILNQSNLSTYFDVNNYVWGLSFAQPPVVSISASPIYVNGGSSTITWSSTYATSCTASDAWTGSKATSGSLSVSPTSVSTYTLSCTGTGGTTVKSVIVGAPQSAPVGIWLLDSSSGTTALDTSGYGQNGTLTNFQTPNWVAGKIGNALSFDGIDDQVKIPESNILKPQQITVAFWVKRNGAQQDWAKMIMKGNGNQSPYGSYKFEFNGASDNQFYWSIGFTDGTSLGLLSTTLLNDNQWYFLTGTYDGSTMNLYVNGTLDKTAQINKTILYDNVPLILGSSENYGAFSGALDEVRVYNRALSLSEIQSLYGSDTTSPTTPTNLSATAVSSSQINLTWTASTDNVAVTGYKIFRGGIQVATSNTTSYSDTGLSASTNYSYTVSAYDAAGNNSTQSSSASATTQASTSNPIGIWLLDSSSGTTVLDTSGNSYSGTLLNYTGTSWVTGKVGNGLNFDSVDDNVKITGSSLNSLTGLTLTAWVNARSSGGNGNGSGTIFSKSGLSSPARFRLLFGSDGSSVQFTANYTVAGIWKTPTGSLPLNSWHHVVATYTHDNVNSVPKIYIDGVQQTLTTTQSPSGTAVSDDDILYIGSRGINPVGVFDGTIDQARIYNREITSTEVTTLYNSENVSGSIDFSLSPSQGTIKSMQAKAVTNSITTTLSSGTTQAVTFSVSGLPTGATASFSPTSCNPTCSTTVNITPLSSTPVGNFTITITGTAGSVSRNTTFTLDMNYSGDINNDGTVNSIDWSLMNAKWFTGDSSTDLNNDGTVNAIDFSLLNANWFKSG